MASLATTDSPEPEAAPAKRWRRFVLWVVATAVLLAALGLGWLVVTAVLARAQLNRAHTALAALQNDVSTQNVGQAKAHEAQLAAYSKRAHQLTTGPAWWVSAQLPVVGGPVRTVRIAALQVHVLASTALPAIVDLSAQLDPATLRTSNGVDVALLAKAAPTVHAALLSASSAESQLQQQPAHTWLPAVDRARATILDRLTPLVATLAGADRATALLPQMLGADGTRRYFVAFENEGEARGLGGLPGAFGILQATSGHVSFSYFGNDSDLDGDSASVGLSPDYLAKWRQADPRAVYVNSDIGASMADAAQIWAGMWQHKTGQRIDGAVAVDPTALSYFLAASGPTSLPDGESVSADNVVALTEQQVYARFSDNASRKAYLMQVARAIDQRLLSAGNAKGMLQAAFTAAGENRLRIWSSHPSEQQVLDTTSFRSTLDPRRSVAGFTVVNAAGTKLDYYLTRSADYQRSECSTADSVHSSMTLTNNAPKAGLPAYVTDRIDGSAGKTKPGDNRVLVTYYASAGAQVLTVSLDGRGVASTVGTENGLATVTVDVELPAGSSHTVQVSLREPDRDGPVSLITQPLVHPMTVQESSPASCS